ncbi:MAG: ABC transporter permease, partial [Clostridiales bacterium]|nr:ABC transporter permease [Clostridiales bacterium]
MIFRNSIKSIIRSRGKSVLFFSLILALTMVLSLGLYLWASVRQYLALCNASYRTIGLIEYMGAEYPDETIDDEGLREAARLLDHAAITSHESVRTWDPSARALGYVDGFTRTDTMIPFKQSAIIVVGSVSPNSGAGRTSAIISECLYSYSDMTGKSVYIDEGGHKLEKGRRYILHGEFYYGRSSYPHFRITGFRGAGGAQISGAADITSADGGYAIESVSAYVGMAQTYRILNNNVSVFATSQLDAMLPFHQRQLYMAEGRGFTPEEYSDGASVCVVTRMLARQCGVGIGDEITLSIAVAPDKPIYETYRAETGFTYEKRFRIVGITNQLTGMNHYVYIPKSEDINLSANQIGYTLGQALLDNDTADRFYRDIEPLLGDRVRLTIYDQGYSSVRGPFEDILRVVVIMTAASAFAALAVLVMFGFLFVYRQRDVSHIMMSLGTGKPRVFLYFLYSSGLIALAGAGVGSTAGYSLSGLAAKLVRLIARGYLDADRRFSISNLTMDMAISFSPRPAISLFVCAALAVVAAALMFCLLYTAGSFVRRQTRRRRPRGPRRPARSSRLPGGPMKYCLLSIGRGGSRSAVVPAVTLVIVLFLSQLAHTSVSYDAKLRQVYDGNVVTGYFTDVNGKQVGALTVEAFLLNEIYASGYI